MMTAVDDYMQNQADDMDDEQEPIAEKAVSKKQQRFMGMVSAAKKGEKPASKEVAKVAKTMKKGDAEDFASTKHKGLPEKAAKKPKEKDVEESTTSGSVATSAAAPKAAKGAGGFTFGKGIYDSMNRELEGMIAESMSMNMSMNNDGNGPTRSLTVTATDEDAIMARIHLTVTAWKALCQLKTIEYQRAYKWSSYVRLECEGSSETDIQAAIALQVKQAEQCSACQKKLYSVEKWQKYWLTKLNRSTMIEPEGYHAIPCQ
jgi:hypothetical protein